LNLVNIASFLLIGTTFDGKEEGGKGTEEGEETHFMSKDSSFWTNDIGVPPYSSSSFRVLSAYCFT
jgi:hypothetical protein